ncbi:MAG: D-alanine--D-alanine ligase [Candidatus Paceibacterota bacterium]|jgi:D-alanine-D-alanine ligase
MSFAHKTRIAVLRGGPSSEYDVSLKTGDAVLKALPSHYEGVDVLISQDGAWHVGGVMRSPEEALRHIDVVFIALHGQYGEDGKVQRVLEHLGVPFTGSRSLSSAIAMNKSATKNALRALEDKVKMAAHKIFSRDEISQKGAHAIFQEISHPSIVKPVSAGSSVGVTVVKSFVGLEEALFKALEHGDSVIVEEFIEGREATCGVIEGFRGEREYALLPVEIVPHVDAPFFDYDAKYGGGSREVCPGNFDEATSRAIREAAQAVHAELGLRHYSRSDFIVHPKRGVYFLEVNTLPGLTSESLFPKSVKAVGSSMPEVLDHIIRLAREKK